MGNYMVLLSHPDCAQVRYPLLVQRNENKDVKVALLPKEQVPPGMAYVPAGVFLAGDPQEGKLQKVFLESYFIDKTEVTGAEYEKFIAATGTPPPDTWEGARACPPELRTCAVHNVSWFEALEYARWAGKRLPTERKG